MNANDDGESAMTMMMTMTMTMMMTMMMARRRTMTRMKLTMLTTMMTIMMTMKMMMTMMAITSLGWIAPYISQIYMKLCDFSSMGALYSMWESTFCSVIVFMDGLPPI